MTVRSTSAAACSVATAGRALTSSMVSPLSSEITHENHLTSSNNQFHRPSDSPRFSLVSTSLPVVLEESKTERGEAFGSLRASFTRV